MEIVLENPSVAPQSARTPAPSSTATKTTSQLGLPIHHPPPPPPPPQHHFPHRKALYDVAAPFLPADEYYARSRHGLTYDRDLEGASAPLTVRRIDKSGLLEIAETDPAVCPRPRVLTGAEDVAARTSVSLRVDRSGLLEAVPEAVDQLEEHFNNGSSSASVEHETVTTGGALTAGGTAMTSMFGEAKAAPQEEMSKADADVNSRVLDGARCPLERPSSLEGQACPDESDTRGHSTDIMVLTGSPRLQFDYSTKATERLPHLSSFSPGPSSLRRPRNDPSKESSMLTSLCVDADSARLRNPRSPEFTAKYSPANSTPRNLDVLATSTTTNPIIRGRPQTAYSKDNFDHPVPISLDNLTVEAIKTSRESLLAKGTAKQENENLPGEERAEAEGCEHTAVEGLEEDKVSFKGSNKLLDNDNVQTLRVIILSEQL